MRRQRPARLVGLASRVIGHERVRLPILTCDHGRPFDVRSPREITSMLLHEPFATAVSSTSAVQAIRHQARESKEVDT